VPLIAEKIQRTINSSEFIDSPVNKELFISNLQIISKTIEKELKNVLKDPKSD